ncbi:hypothetical protein HBI06_111220 [Parastagonospora nodorum]|nr:hypothetical protein HBI06_111220 [Parastagonospora nodorum]KAH4247433.1 hypothetical protein HBI05_045230 [Parastagonospora nodorum]
MDFYTLITLLILPFISTFTYLLRRCASPWPTGLTPWEHFPLMTGYIFADNSVAESVPGFILYNISKGIMATNLSSWSTRWLLCQQINSPTTVLKIRDASKVSKETNVLHVAIAASDFILNVALVVLPALLCDWYGLAASPLH